MSVSSALLPSDCWEVDVCGRHISQVYISTRTSVFEGVDSEKAWVELLLAGGLFSICVNMEFYYLRK